MGHDSTTKTPFLDAFSINRGDTVCITGAGGKTSLLFTLAREAHLLGLTTLVTTTTKIFLPDPTQYHRLDLSGTFPNNLKSGEIIVAGVPASVPQKIASLPLTQLKEATAIFDLILIEADGAGMKRLKGWKETEPVIPESTTITVGVVDIQTVDCTINETLVHRLELFLQLTGAHPGESVSPQHLARMVTGKQGLFQYAKGEKIVYCNKVESASNYKDLRILRQLLPQFRCVGGSLLKKTLEKGLEPIIRDE